SRIQGRWGLFTSVSAEFTSAGCTWGRERRSARPLVRFRRIRWVHADRVGSFTGDEYVVPGHGQMPRPVHGGDLAEGLQPGSVAGDGHRAEGVHATYTDDQPVTEAFDVRGVTVALPHPHRRAADP